jgi:undecaprenyl-diphosphatase
MNFFQALFMGLVQGLTEFLPISSSAHIRILGALTGMQDPGAAFTAIIQLGTETAVLLYFRHDIVRILGGWFRCLFGKEGKDRASRFGAHNKDARMGWFIIIGTVPILIAGLLFQKVIETDLWITVAVLIIFGILLWWFDERSKQVHSMEDLTWRDSLFIGLGQMMALIPGVSRSGGTITVGRALGYTREASARMSFFMAIPAVFGSGILEAVKSVKDVGSMPSFPGWGATIVAALVSFIVGYVVIIAFLKIVSTFSYKGFAIYRVVVAVLVAILLLTGVLSPLAGSAA